MRMGGQQHDNVIECDYLVVGGGSAGCVLASRLAERPEISVCLLESGPSDAGDPRVSDLRRWTALMGTELDYDYAIEPQPRANSQIRQSRGRMLGGCSSHNGGVMIRAQADDFERWSEAGAADWDHDGTTEFFDRVTRTVRPFNNPHRSSYAEAFVRASAAVGLPELPWRAGTTETGAAWFPVTAGDDGNRRSSSVAYIHDRGQRANLRVLTNTTAARVLVATDGRVTGAETLSGVVTARVETILCAGTFDTPKLLMLSGIGPREQLEHVGLPVVCELPAVGEHLVDHVLAVLEWRARQPLAPPAPWHSGQISEVFAVARSSLATTAPDIQIELSAGGAEEVGFLGFGAREATHDDIIALVANVAYPLSQGVVRLISAHPEDPPLIDPRYFSDPAGHDERVLVEGCELARTIASQFEYADWIGEELFPGPSAAGRAELSAAALSMCGTEFHPTGTCRMGPAGSDDCVVDPHLRVQGVDGLRIADASIFPLPVGVNPCMTVMMVAEKAAEMILGDTDA
jgi:choline dehydrogenase-like flavoprotein